MTLLASERSMLIRSKFRSVLQLRMQHRRSQEQMSERNLIPSPVVKKTPAPFPEQNGNLGQNKVEDFMKIKGQNKLHKVAALKMHFPEDALVESDELKEKKARLAEDLNEKILHRPGPLELVKKNILPLATGMKEGMKDQLQISPSSDAFSFEDDISSSCSSSTSSSPRFAPSPGLSLNLSPTSTNTVFQVTVKPSDVGKIQRPKKPKDTKPKVKKLKYHQYIPPDQKTEKAPVAMDAAYSRLLQQQQIFLQLQILNQQQNPTFCVQTVHPLTTSIPADQVISFTGAPPSSAPAINLSPAPGTAAVTTAPTSTVPSPMKTEMLPANIDDLTVSELRQHLRKRGLPVSGTKPSLLERLRPYQIPRAKTIPAPIQSAGLMTPIIELSAFPKQSVCDSTVPTLCTFQTVPSPPSGEVPQETSETACSMPESTEMPATVQDKDTPMQDIEDDHVLMEKQKVIENLTWKLKQEQKQAEDLRVELEMHKRLKNRHKKEKLISRVHIKQEVDRTSPTSCCAKAQTEETPFLYTISNDRTELKPPIQEPQINANLNETYMVFCPPSCDLIGQDFELPMQITASPESPVQKPRSFEEELQEAIQKAQMALCESIEDILEEEEHLMCTDELMHIDPVSNMIEHHSSAALVPQHGHFSKPLYCCSDAPPVASTIVSSSILEFPVSGHYDLLSGQDNLSVIFAPDQIEIPSSPEHHEHDLSPSPSSTSSSSAPFDPADWLEALTSGSASNFGPGSPVGSSIFSTDIFDSPDLSINRMIDLMVEQW
ncbi:myoskeletin L homeolog isoform X2 [Xenopus laevis]|uniref:Myoskeletin L homeolog isoform X2 n=1 Tax=Xenopus laevis TaxID=8355 RepID=A0A8J0T7V9_XENLA|nr:myoskeletin L homeolog isoform X2 [Xenopus laevis]